MQQPLTPTDSLAESLPSTASSSHFSTVELADCFSENKPVTLIVLWSFLEPRDRLAVRSLDADTLQAVSLTACRAVVKYGFWPSPYGCNTSSTLLASRSH